MRFFVFTDVPRANSPIRQFCPSSFPHSPRALARPDAAPLPHDAPRGRGLLACDYVYYVDVDSRFVRPVGGEIFGDLAATIHFGFFDKPRDAFTYECRAASRACVSPARGPAATMPAVFRAAVPRYVAAMRAMDAAIADDERRGVTACWHDESHWNRYLIDHLPAVELGHDYTCPETWRPETQRIVIVGKDNGEMRG